MGISQSGRKLFREKLPRLQETPMERLDNAYAAPLDSRENALTICTATHILLTGTPSICIEHQMSKE